jgi:hypothetical protein
MIVTLHCYRARIGPLGNKEMVRYRRRPKSTINAGALRLRFLIVNGNNKNPVMYDV